MNVNKIAKQLMTDIVNTTSINTNLMNRYDNDKSIGVQVEECGLARDAQKYLKCSINELHIQWILVFNR